MSNMLLDSNREFFVHSLKKREKNIDLSLCYKQAFFQRTLNNSSVITNNNSRVQIQGKKGNTFGDDGLYSSSDTPLTDKVVKPYPLEHQIAFCKSESQKIGKLLEIAIREVTIFSNQNVSKSLPEIISVAVLYKDKVICKTNKPFNRKLHKVHIKNILDSNNLSIQVQAQGGLFSMLPLPLPERPVKQKKIKIDFSLDDHNNFIYSGAVICTISINITGSNFKQKEPLNYLYTPFTNDPNDPRNNFTLVKSNNENSQKQVHYFLLKDPALCLSNLSPDTFQKQTNVKKKFKKSPDIVIIEQNFSLMDISLGSCFQENGPLRSTSEIIHAPKHHAGRKQVLTVTILRGVEVPVREESALVRPVIEVEWANIIHSTEPSDGPAPIWQQTLEFDIPTARISFEHCIKFRLFDVHPVWGAQWLGEARIPLECHQNYQQLERWVGLSPVYSPAFAFGYVQAAPGHSYTRIYVLMKMEQMATVNSLDDSSINKLSKAIQRCLVVPYKVAEIKTSEDAQKLVMLLDSLSVHYGPLTPKQALNLNKVDHFGRSALLATLLQGLGLSSYVLLGSSQIRLWDSFVLTVDENSKILLWDAENGDYYNIQDSNRCALFSVSHMINNLHIWENTRKMVSPATLNYDVKTSKDFELQTHSTVLASRNQQAVDLNIMLEEDKKEKDVAHDIEENLRENLILWRTAIELPTIFNRHADSILRQILEKAGSSTNLVLDKKELRQLYRAYYTHGFIINVRYTDFKDLSNFLLSTKTHAMTGPIEFALVCHVKKLVGKVRSVWIAVVILRTKS